MSETSSASTISFSLTAVPPFRLDLTVWALRRRSNNNVDLWDGRFYQRLLRLDGVGVLLRVAQSGSPERPRLAVTAVAQRVLPRLRERVGAALNRILGLRVDLSKFYEMARENRRIRPLVERFIGVKPPRFPTMFEALLNAVACQQLTVLVGIMLLNRLATRLDASSSDVLGPLAFPRPSDMAVSIPRQLRALGFSQRKAETILTIARACADDENRFEELASLPDDKAIGELLSVKGIGRWSAQYVLLRGLGRLNVFPADDVAGQSSLRRWLGLRTKPDYEEARKLLSHWHPYEGVLYFHFLLADLDSQGFLR
jgi:DNA-3-methyladenine glycosylase II